MAGTYYDLLAVPDTASDQEIAAAYRKWALKLHPDRRNFSSPEEEQKANEKLKLINQAYSVLKNREKRARYDESLCSGADYARDELLNQTEETQRRMLRRLEDAFSRLCPNLKWTMIDDEEGYFDFILLATRSTQLFKVFVKLLDSVVPRIIPGFTEYAEEKRTAAKQSMTIEHHCYLVLGHAIEDLPLVSSYLVPFNRQAWSRSAYREAKSFIAVSPFPELDVFVPGIDKVFPDVTRLSLDDDDTGGVMGGKILVVDDEPLARMVISDALTEAGYEVQDAFDWPSFKRKILEESFSVVILDINLPLLTGDKLAMFIRNNPEIDPKPKIIVHSGLAENELSCMARSVGAFSYLKKGCDDTILRDTVEKALRAN